MLKKNNKKKLLHQWAEMTVGLYCTESVGNVGTNHFKSGPIFLKITVTNVGESCGFRVCVCKGGGCGQG